MHKNKKFFYAKLPLDIPISALSSGKNIQNYFLFFVHFYILTNNLAKASI